LHNVIPFVRSSDGISCGDILNILIQKFDK